MTATDSQISIAIIGAGISSLCLARGLLKHKHIDVRIYEARPLVGQHDGSGIGIAANGQKALRLIDPELPSCLHRAGGVKSIPTVKFMMATGPRSGEALTDIYSDPPQRTVRRSRLLDELRSVLPDSVVVTGKRLVSIDERSDAKKKVSLTFEDGDVIAVDAVVGADGVNSIVRQHIIDGESSTDQLNWQPGCNIRLVIPISEARRILGEAYCSQATQIGWIGQSGFCLTDHEDDGQSMQVIASLRAKEPVEGVHGKPYVQVETEFWTSRLKEWDLGWIGEKICQVIEEKNSVYASCARQHDETPVYSKGRICLAGDAAGNFSPALGAGASQGIEDALVLATILGEVGEPDELEKAFKAYDSIRRPRRKWVAVESNKQDRTITGRMQGVGVDVAKLEKAVQEPYDLLLGYDLEGVVQEAGRWKTTP